MKNMTILRLFEEHLPDYEAKANEFFSGATGAYRKHLEAVMLGDFCAKYFSEAMEAYSDELLKLQRDSCGCKCPAVGSRFSFLYPSDYFRNLHLFLDPEWGFDSVRENYVISLGRRLDV